MVNRTCTNFDAVATIIPPGTGFDFSSKFGANWRKFGRRQCRPTSENGRTFGKDSKDVPNSKVYFKNHVIQGGPGAKIGLLTMAADDPQLEAQRVAELFAQHGANATWIPVTTTSNNADDSAVVSLTVGQDGFFFATGTRSRVLTALRRNDVDSQVLTAIRVKLRAGAMVAGNSAGMAVLVGTFFSIQICRNLILID